VVVAGIYATHGIEGLFLCTLMAGVILIGMGVSGIGSAIKYIPRPVIVGFTNGIAVLIASTQIRDFFGLQVDRLPDDFIERTRLLVERFPTISWEATALGAACLATIVIVVRLNPRVPGTVVALVGGTLAAMLLDLKVETIGSRFGDIPSTLPAFHLPDLPLSLIPQLLSPAITVALLGGIESLLSATVADRMTGTRHNPNMELVAQGAANLASPLFGGLPATGAIARTATNIRSGARTPVAGMIHALTLLLVVLFGARLASHIPLAVLASILFVVAYNMGDWGEIRQLLKLTKADIVVWTATFTLTVVADLTVAVEVGMILAALLFIRRVAETTSVARVTPELVEEGEVHTLQGKSIPAYAAMYRIHGPFLFGATDKVGPILDAIDQQPPIVILRMRHVPAIDASGLQALEDLADRLHESGRTLLLCGARDQPARVMQRAEFHEHLGEGNICANVEAALERAATIAAEKGLAA
jgi:SulP family sulfate permease